MLETWNCTVSHEEFILNPRNISTTGEPRAKGITKHSAFGVTCCLLAGSANSTERTVTCGY